MPLPPRQLRYRSRPWCRGGEMVGAGGAAGAAPAVGSAAPAVGSAAHVLAGCLGWPAHRELHGSLRSSVACFCPETEGPAKKVGAPSAREGQGPADIRSSRRDTT